MSARTPFFNPKANLLSSARHTPPAAEKDPDTSIKSSNSELSNELTNPANSPHSGQSHNSAGTQPNSNEQPKLNVSGLIGRKTQARKDQHSLSVRRSSTQETGILRPGTADPFKATTTNGQEQQRKLNISSMTRQGSFPPRILAPIPRSIPPNPAFVSVTTSNVSTTLKAPVLPQPADSNLAPSSELNANSSSSSEDQEHFSFTDGNLSNDPSFVIMSTTASDSSSSSINSQMRRRSGRSPVTLNVSMANQPGPRRIPLEPLEYRGNFKRPRGDQDPSSEEREESGEDSARAQKRYRAENDSFGPQGHETQYRRTSSQYSENVPQSHRQAQYADTSSPSDGYSAHQEHGRGVPQHDFNPHGYMSQDDYPPPPPPPALDRILGRSVDAYISDHMEQYDRSVKRWKDCSMEEWIKGAEEITAKYTKILDFVKSHMNTKIKLFASFDGEIDTHNKLLDERAATLANVKEKLVTEGGNVLGGMGTMNMHL